MLYRFLLPEDQQRFEALANSITQIVVTLIDQMLKIATQYQNWTYATYFLRFIIADYFRR